MPVCRSRLVVWLAFVSTGFVLEGFSQVRNDTLKLRQLSEKLGGSNFRVTRPDSILFYVSKGLSLAIAIDDKMGMADMHMYYGIYYKITDDLAQSLDHFENSRKLYEELGKRDRVAVVLNEMGRIYRHLGDFDRSIDCYDNAYRYFEAKGDQKGLASAANSFGIIYTEFGDYQTAIEMFERAIELDSSSRSRPLTNLGNVFFMMAKYDSAAFYQRKSLYLKQRQGDVLALPIPYANLGEIMLMSGNYDEAIGYLDSAYLLSSNSSNFEALIFTLTTLARVKIKQNDFEEAEKYLLQAYKLALDKNFTNRLIDVYEWLTLCYRQMGRYKEAFSYSDKFLILKDSVYNRDKAAKFSNLRVIYEVDKKNATIELLRKDKSISELTIKLTISVALAIILFVGLVAFRLRQRTRERELVIHREAKEKLEVEVNLRTEELLQKKDELEVANRVKDKLFSIISHDLKAPLNSLKGTLSILQMGGLQVEEFKSLLNDIGLQLQSTSQFMENLLHWSRSQMQGIRVQPLVFSIHELCREVTNLMSTEFERKSILLSVEVDPEIKAYADPDMIQIVIRNVVSNAFKFTKPGGSVKIKGYQQCDQVRISIEDSGTGIDPGRVSSLFTLDGTSTLGTCNEKGTGLGLVLCKEFIERNFGKICVATKEGQGTTITISIPVGADQH